jgi:hypothetical protein
MSQEKMKPVRAGFAAYNRGYLDALPTYGREDVGFNDQAAAEFGIARDGKRVPVAPGSGGLPEAAHLQPRR